MAQKNIFRKVALKQLTSPDQLDQLMKITGPREWIALATFLAIMLAMITWGFVGRIPIKVAGRGILIKTGGIVDILAKSKGELTTLYVESGDIVEKGDPIARVDQAGLIDELSVARKLLEDLQIRKQNKAILNQVGRGKERNQIHEQKQSIEQTVQQGQVRLRELKERINVTEQLVADGLITRKSLRGYWQDFADVEKEIAGCVLQLNELEIQQAEEQLVEEGENFALNQEIRKIKRNIASLELKIDLFSKVVSPFQGKIIEVATRIGNLVKPGDRLLSLEKTGSLIDLELILYVSPGDGKKIEIGKVVQISPSTVKREEYGYVLGLITSVSAFPASRNSMMQILNNERLVEMFSGNEAPVAVHANLIPAPKNDLNRSGFKWSSPNGPPVELTTGTFCSAEITIKNNRPLSFVIPGIDSIIDKFTAWSRPLLDSLTRQAHAIKKSVDKVMIRGKKLARLWWNKLTHLFS